MSLSLSAIQYVTGGLSLVAFVVAIIYNAYRANLKHQESKIRSAPKSQRIIAITAVAEYLHIDPKLIPPDQLPKIVLTQIHARSQRELTRSLVAFGTAILLSVVTIVAIVYASKNDEGNTHKPSDVKNGDAQACVGRAPAPKAREIVEEYADFLSSLLPQLHYVWSGGNVARGIAPKDGVSINDIVAKDDRLLIRYDWQNGELDLTPVEVGYSARFVIFRGGWAQKNGHGCIILDFPLLENGKMLEPAISMSGLVSGQWTSDNGETRSAAITCANCKGMIPIK